MLRVKTEEGHYTIKRVDRLPDKGNANWLYTFKELFIKEFYRWDAFKNKYETIKVGETDYVPPVFKVVENRYSTIGAMYLDQGNQTDTFIQYVEESTGYKDASGKAYFEYLGTTNNSEEDYRKLTDAETVYLDASIQKTSDIPLNDGADGTSTYVELDELGTVATSNNYNDLDNLPTNTSSLTNDGEDGINPYITLLDIPSFDSNDYDLTDFTNIDVDPFARISDLNSGITNLTYTPSPTQGTVNSDTGTDAVLPLADGTNAGLITAAEKTSIGTALQPTDNISELTNDVGYITTFTETDPIFQASQAALFVAGDKTNLDNQSGINTGDETTGSIQTKRPLKTVNGQSLEGAGDIPFPTSTADFINQGADNTSTYVEFDELKVNYLTEITDASYSLLQSDAGAFNFLTFNRTTPQQITVDDSIFTTGDIINIWRKGAGSVEIIEGAGVNINGIKDVDGKFYINNKNSPVCLICVAPSEFRIFGNLTSGFIEIPEGLVRYYRFNSNPNEYSSQDNGIGTSMTYSSNMAVFSGNDSYIDISDSDAFSFGDGTTDSDFSISLLVNIDVIEDAYLIAKRGSPDDKEWQFDFFSGTLRFIAFDQSSGGTINKSFTHGMFVGTNYHIGVTHSGGVFKMYKDGVSQSLTDASSGSYTAMENLLSVIRIGAKPFSLTDSEFDGRMRGIGIWNKVLSDDEMLEIATKQLTGTDLV